MENINNSIRKIGRKKDVGTSPNSTATDNSVQQEHRGLHDKPKKESSTKIALNVTNQEVIRLRLPPFSTIKQGINQQTQTASMTKNAMTISEKHFSKDNNERNILGNTITQSNSTQTNIEKRFSILENNDVHFPSTLSSRMKGACEETPLIDFDFSFPESPNWNTDFKFNTEIVPIGIKRTNSETDDFQGLLPSQLINFEGNIMKSNYSQELGKERPHADMEQTNVSLTVSFNNKNADTELMGQTFDDKTNANLAHKQLECKGRSDTSDIHHTYKQTNSFSTTPMIQKAKINSATQPPKDLNYSNISFNKPSEPTSAQTNIINTSSMFKSNEPHLRKSSILDSRMTGVCEQTPQVDNSSLNLDTSHHLHTVPESITENLSHEINQTNIETVASQSQLPYQHITVCGKRNKSDYVKKLHLRSVALRRLELQNQCAFSYINDTTVNVTDYVTNKDAKTESLSQTSIDNAAANLSHFEMESERRLDTSDNLYTKQQTSSLLSCYIPRTNSGGNTLSHGTLECSKLFLQSASTSNTWQKGRHVSHDGSHLVEKHNKCHVCHKSFPQLSALNDHDCMAAIGNPCKCTHCDKTLRANCPTEIKQHERADTEEKSYKCQTCGRSFNLKSNLTVHKRGHTGVKPYECKTCGKSFNRSDHLKEHERIHSGEKLYECKTCGKSFLKNGDLVNHERIHSGEKPFVCKTCGKSFNVRNNLKTHERIHSGEKPYECKTCGKSFNRSDHLKEHERIHSGEKLYECKTCGKSFLKNCDLVNHERIHSGEKPFVCKTCGKSFNVRNNLKTHERIHSGEKPYECKTCGKSFNQSNSLKTHERIHSGEKPFECKTCGTSFNRSHHLKQHERIHSGEKPFECKTCGKLFNVSNNLKQHERIHSGEKPYECKTCGKSFFQNGNLVKHERIHSGENHTSAKSVANHFVKAFN